MEDMQNERRTNRNQGNESMLYSFCALMAALLLSGIKRTAIRSLEDALVQLRLQEVKLKFKLRCEGR